MGLRAVLVATLVLAVLAGAAVADVGDWSKITFRRNIEGNAGIWWMDDDGSDQATLYDSSRLEYYADLSPDGTQVVFDRSEGGNTYDLWKMNVDGTGLTDITPPAVSGLQNVMATWSPDGATIAFAATTSSTGSIWVMDPDGTGAVSPPTGGRDHSPAWSPDGTKLAFCHQAGGDYGDLFIMNADGTGLTQLTSGSAQDVFSSWSPDGQSIVFQRSPTGDWLDDDIWRVNVDGTGLTQLTSQAGADESPCWSWDGTRIAFASQMGVRSDRANRQICLMNPDGTGIINISSSAYDDTSPMWRGGAGAVPELPPLALAAAPLPLVLLGRTFRRR